MAGKPQNGAGIANQPADRMNTVCLEKKFKKYRHFSVLLTCGTDQAP